MPEVQVPNGWNRAAHDAWQENKRQESINLVLAELNAQAAKPPRLTMQLCYYLFLLGDYRAAAKFLYLQSQQTPDHVEVLLNLAVCLSRISEHAKAIEYANKVLERDPENYVACDTLTASFYQLQQFENAVLSGQRSLNLKKSMVLRRGATRFQLPSSQPSEWVKNKKNVISFSLWGKHPRYLRGALQNLLLQPKIYPNWTCRFYVDKTVPDEFINILHQQGAEVVDRASTTLGEKLCWRFQVANDPEVGYFLVRDADSVISEREADLVAKWIDSEQYFHVMRDWWTHTDLMLAGMWGGVANILPSITTLFAQYTSKHVATPNIDQWFLRDCVWSLIRPSCQIDDRFFAQPWTALANCGVMDGRHIGQNEFAAHFENQAAYLREWIGRLPCLTASDAKEPSGNT